MTPPERLDLDAIEQRVLMATPAPWRTDRDEYPNAVVAENANICGLYDGGQTRDSIDANARFIAHSPEDVRALVAEVRRQQERCRQLEAALAEFVEAEEVQIVYRVEALHAACLRAKEVLAALGRDEET